MTVTYLRVGVAVCAGELEEDTSEEPAGVKSELEVSFFRSFQQHIRAVTTRCGPGCSAATQLTPAHPSPFGRTELSQVLNTAQLTQLSSVSRLSHGYLLFLLL